MSDVLQPSATRPSTPHVPQAREVVKRREPVTAAPIPTYYDQPALKPSHYGWKVSSYISIGGLAGSAQIVATLADLVDREGFGDVVRKGRYFAVAGALAGAPLLIVDLHTPQRFYNMLRIFRPTSPMSIGSYVLLGFGGVSAVLAGAQLGKDTGLRSVRVEAAAKALQLPAAVLGAAMSTYTGALLAATSTPLWAAAPRLLPATFGAAAMSSAAAALSLAGAGAAAPALEKLEAVSSALEIWLLQLLVRDIRAKGVRTRIGLLPVVLLAGAPLLRAARRIDAARAQPALPGPSAPAAARASRHLAAWAPIAVLAGSFLLRHLILQAGNRSARRPRDHFRFAGRR
jgi:formate-dependent nitrite reductase membrane component NrfD